MGVLVTGALGASPTSLQMAAASAFHGVPTHLLVWTLKDCAISLDGCLSALAPTPPLGFPGSSLTPRGHHAQLLPVVLTPATGEQVG